MKTVTTLLNYVMIFVSLNKGAKANSKQLMKEALDIGVALHQVAKTKQVDQKTKDALANEVKEFNAAVNKFLDDLVIPD